MDDVFRAMGLVGLRDEAATAVELCGEFLGESGIGAERQMADEVWR
jgi:hypothetical protein